MTEEERYLFDVRGYMVLNQVLNEKELATLNATFDENQMQSENPNFGRARYLDLISWGKT